MEKLCEYCEEPFETKRTDTKFCSHSCRQMDYLDRKMNLSVNLNGSESSFTSGNADETSIDGSQNVKPSIDDSQNSHKNNLEPSNLTLKNVNTSIDISELSVNSKDNKASIDILNQQNNSSETSKQPEYIPFQSTFLNSLDYLGRDGENRVQLSFIIFEKDAIPEVSWVSVRLRCLTECLLTFSEMKFVELNTLKEACNCFTQIIKSSFYKRLPKRYPFTTLILKLREDLKRICLENEDDSELRFRLRAEYKKELIVARCDLARYFPKRNFVELNFKA